MSEGTPCRVIRSRRRTLSLEITPRGEVLVRAPLRTSEAVIRRFVEGKQGWIETHLALVRERMAAADAQERFTEAERNALRERARPVFEARVNHFASLLGMSRGKITIRTQRSRWGSCSANGNISINVDVVCFEQECIDYVVIHELCHLKHMDHSADFWALVATCCPEYKRLRERMKH